MSSFWQSFCAAFGICGAATGFAVWLIQRRITKRSDEQKKAEEDRCEFEIHLMEGVSASIALAEATARAVQRIPDAHCNGDMHSALNYAADVKHRQKDFLNRKGIKALFDD